MFARFNWSNVIITLINHGKIYLTNVNILIRRSGTFHILIDVLRSPCLNEILETALTILAPMKLLLTIIEYHCLARINPMVAFMTGSIRACSSGMTCPTKSSPENHYSLIIFNSENGK